MEEQKKIKINKIRNVKIFSSDIIKYLKNIVKKNIVINNLFFIGQNGAGYRTTKETTGFSR